MSGWSVERAERAAVWFMIAVTVTAFGWVLTGAISHEAAFTVAYFASWPKIVATEYRLAQQPKRPKRPRRSKDGNPG